MIRGSCLCGTVKFELAKAVGPFEICHCNRCRKMSGSNSLAMVGVLAEDYSLLQGEKMIRKYEAPALYDNKAYTSHFCGRRGSPSPPQAPSEFFQIPAGLLDDSPRIEPDKHIFTEFTPEWGRISDDLPQFTLRDLYRLRHGKDLPSGFKLVSRAMTPAAPNKARLRALDTLNRKSDPEHSKITLL